MSKTALSLVVAIGIVGAALTAAAAQSCEVTGRWAPSKLSRSGELRAEARFSPSTRMVSLTWLYYGGGDFSTSPDASHAQTFTVRYVPTALDFANPDRLVVAGETNGRTIVEVWTLEAPEVSVQGEDVRWVTKPRERIDPVLDEATPELGCIRDLLWNRGGTGSSFARFTQSDDLYEVTWAGPDLGKLESVLCAAAEPALQGDRPDLWGSDHSQHGYVYVFEETGAADLQPGLFLFDGDRDGELDSHSTMTVGQAAAMGLQDLTKYHEYQGCKPVL